MTPQELEKSVMIPTYAQRDISLERGEGMYLWDTDGNKYMDLGSQYGITALGHAHPVVNEHIKAQLDKLPNCHRSFFNQARAEHCEKLKKHLPDQICRFYLTNIGAETVESAMKFARLATGKQQIIAMTGAYHGRLFGSLTITFNPKHHKGYGELLPHCTFSKFNDLEALKETITDDTAAIILEFLQGEGGIHPIDPTFAEGARKLCDEKGILLIADEIQSGMGRTGKMWAFEHTSVIPDMVCISKGVGNGFPLGAVAVTEAVSEKIHRGAHGATFGGSPLAAAAGIGTLEVFEKENIVDHVAEVGAYFLEQLKTIECDRIRDIRGMGLMLAIEFKEKCGKYIKTLQERGYIVLPVGGATTIRILPPLIITKEQIDEFVSVLQEVLNTP